MAVNVGLIDYYDSVLPKLEDQIERSAPGHDPIALALLRSVPGIGHILALVILYEIERIERFGRAQDFLSYCRLVKPMKESAGKVYGHSGKKIGNVHLKWAFSEAAVLFVRHCTEGKKLLARMEKRFGKGKALSILAHKLGRAAYYMLARGHAFDLEKFMATGN